MFELLASRLSRCVVALALFFAAFAVFVSPASARPHHRHSAERHGYVHHARHHHNRYYRHHARSSRFERSAAQLRRNSAGEALVTDEGHLILDAGCGRIERPEELAAALNAVPGVVEHGLFLGLATGALIATREGVLTLGRV